MICLSYAILYGLHNISWPVLQDSATTSSQQYLTYVLCILLARSAVGTLRTECATGTILRSRYETTLHVVLR